MQALFGGFRGIAPKLLSLDQAEHVLLQVAPYSGLTANWFRMQHPPAYVCIERRKRDAQGRSSLARGHVAVARRHNLFPYTLISQSRLTAYRLADDIRKGT